MNFLKNIYYKWRIDYKVSCFDFKPYIKILEEFNKFTVLTFDDNAFHIAGNIGRIDCFKNSENTEYDIYYENMHLHVTDTEKDKVATISLKKSKDEWTMTSVNGIVDVSNPVNDTMEIFCWYDVMVMNRKRCEGYEYIEGAWNKYFYCTLLELEKNIVDLTLISQFTEEYGTKKENKNFVK